jgi:HEAT repeat protein
MDIDAALEQVFKADAALRAAEAQLLGTRDKAALEKALARRVEQERGDKGADAAGNLVRLADLCAQVVSPTTLDALVRILDHDDPQVRVAAGEALVEIGIDRFKDVRGAVERALTNPSLTNALEELPFILAELGDPPSVALVARFLELPQAQAVAAGIEALAAMGDPGAIPHLRKLAQDGRDVTIAEEGVGELRMTIGELSQDAIAELTAEAPGP